MALRRAFNHISVRLPTMFSNKPARYRPGHPYITLLACALGAGLGTAALMWPTTTQRAPIFASRPLIELGGQLFRSPLLSADGTVSCSTCHVPSLGFSGDRPLALGVAGYVGGRRAPSLLGLHYAMKLMWDGRATSLLEQVTMPLEAAEMAVVWPEALARLRVDPQLQGLLQAAHIRKFSRETVVTALAAYVSSLNAGSSRFDRFYYGHDQGALTPQEAWGLRLFVRKAGCASCHLIDGRDAPFSDGGFHVTGIVRQRGMPPDRGRAAVTGDAADEGAFKTPSLRGVAIRPYLMHDGSVTSLMQAVEHYNRLSREGFPNLDKRLGPLFLTEAEQDAIVAFLAALTPEEANDGSSAPKTP